VPRIERKRLPARLARAAEVAPLQAPFGFVPPALEVFRRCCYGMSA